ncbi:MAG: UbiA family prenyltransferase [Verrucomicrobiales bacterium]
MVDLPARALPDLRARRAILAFSSSAVCYSRLLRGDPGLPGAAALLVASVASFFFFLQLRIADEFKDFEEDSRYRPYRPVPRGLVTLRSLGWLFVIGGAAQLATALWFHPPLAAVLIARGFTWR